MLILRWRGRNVFCDIYTTAKAWIITRNVAVKISHSTAQLLFITLLIELLHYLLSIDQSTATNITDFDTITIVPNNRV